MAERRMFAKTIIDSDAFLDMPLSTQTLYFHLSMRADDDGFINNPKKIQRMVGCSDDDLKLLCAKNFIIPFESGIVVIKHWRIHNYIRNDRYKPTAYADEKAQLTVKENGAYTLNPLGIPDDIQMDTIGIPDGYHLDTQVRLGKDRDRVNNIYSPGNPDDKPKRKTPKQPEWASEVVDYLNEKTGKHFKASSSANVKFISARAKEGYTAEDFKKVIDTKVTEWKGTDMEQYLRPETLFSASKFEAYLNQKTTRRSAKNDFNNFDQHDYDMSELTKKAKRRINEDRSD